MVDGRVDARLLLLSGGVVTLHTAVTVLEEALFASPRFTAEAGSTFMTLVFYTFSALAYLPAACRSRRHATAHAHASRQLWLLLAVATL